MAIDINHGTQADGTFSPQGAAAWNAAHSFSGLTANALLYSTDATTLAQDGTNLLYTTASGPRFQVGSGTGTSAGWTLGYSGSSGYALLIPTGLTVSNNNATILSNGGNTYIQTSDASGGQMVFQHGGTQKMRIVANAGWGPEITAGTAAAASVYAMRLQRTNNHANVDKGVSFEFTDTTSASGFLPFQVLGGAAASTNLLSVSKAGLVDAPAYAAGGTAGVDFGPGAVASITVKKGIITAIS